MEPFPAIFEPLTESVVIGLLASWAMSHLWEFSAALIFIKHVLLWFVLDFILLRCVHGVSEFSLLVISARNEFLGMVFHRTSRIKIFWSISKTTDHPYHFKFFSFHSARHTLAHVLIHQRKIDTDLLMKLQKPPSCIPQWILF